MVYAFTSSSTCTEIERLTVFYEGFILSHGGVAQGLVIRLIENDCSCRSSRDNRLGR